MNIQSIIIIGRRWRDKLNGNTYHSCNVYVNGKHAARVEFTYGYGNQVEYTGMSALHTTGKLPDWDTQRDTPWGYCERHNINYEREIIDVQRKKDL